MITRKEKQIILYLIDKAFQKKIRMPYDWYDYSDNQKDIILAELSNTILNIPTEKVVHYDR